MASDQTSIHYYVVLRYRCQIGLKVEILKPPFTVLVMFLHSYDIFILCSSGVAITKNVVRLLEVKLLRKCP